MLGALTFLAPWMLGALAVVPVLWWLLRLMPPRPKTVLFPAFFLLKDLKAEIKTAAHTPWWMLLLRSLIVIFFVLALAEPVRHLSSTLPGSEGSVLIAVDNGWAAAAEWQKRADKMREYLPEIKRSGRSVIFLPTAPAHTDGKLRAAGPMDAAEAEQWIAHAVPEPWPADAAAARKTAEVLLRDKKVTHTLFLDDGTASSVEDKKDLLSFLQSHGGGLTVLRDAAVNQPYILTRISEKPGDLSFRLTRRDAAGQDKPLSLAAFGADGRILDEYRFSFPAGEVSFQLSWDILPEIKGKVARITLRQTEMAAAVFLTDSQWRQHPVGIAADAARKESKSFLNEVYYLRRALEGFGEPSIDNLDALIKKPLAALIWPDSAPLTAVERVTLLEWVQGGGFLIRFAGPGLAANPDDPLLPVALRYGQRSMEGAMTWEKPVSLGAAPETSPLFGLAVPADVSVTRQVLAEPAPETFEKTWFALEDGTPLITGNSLGKGAVVLVHTTAGPDWSNFCYSGLYVEALQRMVQLSAGIVDYKADRILPPVTLMDGFGRLFAPEEGIVSAIDPDKGFTPSPETPPGIYGDQQQFKVFNLGDAIGRIVPFNELPSGAAETNYQLSGEKSLKDLFFKVALLLLALDVLLSFWLRGGIALPARAAAVFFALWLFPSPAPAQEVVDLAGGIYLAYVETGDADTDAVSYNGLSALAEVINARTTIKIKGVQGVDPAADILHFFPFLYWPMTEGQNALSGAAARHLQNYLGQGGMIVFDTRDQQFSSEGDAEQGYAIGTKKLRTLTHDLSIPELMPVPDSHILTKSFYLLQEFPGRFAGGRLWVEKEPNASHDAVTSVIIGGNDWASAWSGAGEDRARFSPEPGGEQQREMAYRFGVNLIMMALAGNYKADQVHVPYILERMGR